MIIKKNNKKTVQSKKKKNEGSVPKVNEKKLSNKNSAESGIIIDIPEKWHTVVEISGEKYWVSSQNNNRKNVGQTIKGKVIGRYFANSIKKNKDGDFNLRFIFKKHDELEKRELLFYNKKDGKRYMVSPVKWAENNNNLKINDNYDLDIIKVGKIRRSSRTEEFSNLKEFTVLLQFNEYFIILNNDTKEKFFVSSSCITQDDVGNNIFLELQEKIYIFNTIINSDDGYIRDIIPARIDFIKKDGIIVNSNGEKIWCCNPHHACSDLCLNQEIEIVVSDERFLSNENSFLVDKEGQYKCVSCRKNQPIFLDLNTKKLIRLFGIRNLDPTILGKRFSFVSLPKFIAFEKQKVYLHPHQDVDFNNKILKSSYSKFKECLLLSKDDNNIIIAIKNGDGSYTEAYVETVGFDISNYFVGDTLNLEMIRKVSSEDVY